MPEVTFVIPILLHSRYLLRMTRACLDNLVFFTDVSYEIVVVHNYSSLFSDEMEKHLKDLYVPYNYIKNQSNQFDSKTMNQGIAAATTDYICILNNDVMVHQSWYEPVKQLLIDDKLDLATPYTRQMYRKKHYKGLDQDFTYCSVPEALSGACIFSRKTYDKIGPFNEELNFYSDRDYMKRCNALNMRVGMSLNSYVTHISAMTWVSPDEATLKKDIFGWDFNEMLEKDTNKMKELYG